MQLYNLFAACASTVGFARDSTALTEVEPLIESKESLNESNIGVTPQNQRTNSCSGRATNSTAAVGTGKCTSVASRESRCQDSGKVKIPPQPKTIALTQSAKRTSDVRRLKSEALKFECKKSRLTQSKCCQMTGDCGSTWKEKKNGKMSSAKSTAAVINVEVINMAFARAMSTIPPTQTPSDDEQSSYATVHRKQSGVNNKVSIISSSRISRLANNTTTERIQHLENETHVANPLNKTSPSRPDLVDGTKTAKDVQDHSLSISCGSAVSGDHVKNGTAVIDHPELTNKEAMKERSGITFTATQNNRGDINAAHSETSSKESHSDHTRKTVEDDKTTAPSLQVHGDAANAEGPPSRSASSVVPPSSRIRGSSRTVSPAPDSDITTIASDAMNIESRCLENVRIRQIPSELRMTVPPDTTESCNTIPNFVSKSCSTQAPPRVFNSARCESVVTSQRSSNAFNASSIMHKSWSRKNCMQCPLGNGMEKKAVKSPSSVSIVRRQPTAPAKQESLSQIDFMTGGRRRLAAMSLSDSLALKELGLRQKALKGALCELLIRSEQLTAQFNEERSQVEVKAQARAMRSLRLLDKDPQGKRTIEMYKRFLCRGYENILNEKTAEEVAEKQYISMRVADIQEKMRQRINSQQEIASSNLLAEIVRIAEGIRKLDFEFRREVAARKIKLNSELLRMMLSPAVPAETGNNLDAKDRKYGSTHMTVVKDMIRGYECHDDEYCCSKRGTNITLCGFDLNLSRTICKEGWYSKAADSAVQSYCSGDGTVKMLLGLLQVERGDNSFRTSLLNQAKDSDVSGRVLNGSSSDVISPVLEPRLLDHQVVRLDHYTGSNGIESTSNLLHEEGTLQTANNDGLLNARPTSAASFRSAISGRSLPPTPADSTVICSASTNTYAYSSGGGIFLSIG